MSITEELSRLIADGTVRGESRAVVVGQDPIGPSPHRLAEASAAAMATFGRELAALDEDRGAPAQTVTVTATDAFDQLRAPFLADVNGVALHRLTDDPGLLGLNDFYPTRDGWVFLLFTYPHLRDAVCSVLDSPPTAAAITARTRRRDAVALEEAVVAAGGVAVAVRTAQEWDDHPAGRHLAGRPVVEVDRLDDAEPREATTSAVGNGWQPLGGVRVLDDTHVIAGPVSTRLLGQFGADVLHVSSPRHPDPLGMLAITGGGKRNAYLDVTEPEQRRRFDALAGEADVVVTSYRGLARKGLGPLDLARRHPGVVVAELHGWGADGPWAQRGGFDQLACAATGFALEEGGDHPTLPPTHLLNDYLAAYLAAAGVVGALRRRSVDGGSWRVRVNLAAVCMWVRSLGVVPPTAAAPAPSIARHTVVGPMGAVTEPVLPIAFSGHQTPQAGAATLLGTARPEFVASLRASRRRPRA